jgi:hypothetical protein
MRIAPRRLQGSLAGRALGQAPGQGGAGGIEGLQDRVLLGGEVAEERPPGHAHCRRDVVDCRLVEALGGEQREGGAGQLGADGSLGSLSDARWSVCGLWGRRHLPRIEEGGTPGIYGTE